MTLGGGWPVTGFSGNEWFLKEAVRGFTAAAAARGDAVKARYLGNAKSFMIEQSGDAHYLELANLAMIDAHSSPFGISIEYVPASAAAIDWPGHYKWGDEGILQWLILAGCEALGFPLGPDGKLSPNGVEWYGLDVTPVRWAESFAGVSGVCGYRSLSWYSKGILTPEGFDMPNVESIASLPFEYGAMIIRQLDKGRTFYEAWCQAADYVHRRLGHKVDVAVMCNDSACLGDTFHAFQTERQYGLDQSSVRWSRVGSGKPCSFYGYSPRVNAAGRPVYPKPAWNHWIEENLWLADGLKAPAARTALPILVYGASDALHPGLQKMGISSDADLEAGDFALPPSNIAFSDIVRNVGKSDRLALIEDSETDSALWNVTVNDQHYPVLHDGGFALRSDSGRKNLAVSNLSVVAERGVRELPGFEDALRNLARAAAPGRILLIDADWVYAKFGTAESGDLEPRLGLSFLLSMDGERTWQGYVTLA